MTSRLALAGRRILLVEDNYMIAMDMVATLREAGAALLGPASRLDQALALLHTSRDPPDFAVLDLDLHGVPSYPVADALIERGVPFLFTTGFNSDGIAARYRSYPRLEKPVRDRTLLAALATAG